MASSILEKFQFDQQTTTSRMLIVLILLLLVTMSYFMANLLIPLVLSVFVAYLINPMVIRLEKYHIPGPIAIALPLIGILLFLTLVGMLFYNSIDSFVNNPEKLNSYLNNIKGLYQNVKQELYHYGILKESQNFDIIEELIAQGKKYLLSFISSTTSFFSYFMLFVLYLLFLLPGIRNFRIKINRAFPRSRARKINAVNDKISYQIQQYIKAKSMISILTGTLVFLYCTFFGVDFPIIWGVLTMILNFIPNFGSVLASLLPISLAIFQFESSLSIVAFTSIIAGTQFAIGNLLEPKLLAKSLSLSPLVVLIALFFWGWLWGVVGIVLSVPIMASISIICKNIKPLRPVGIFLQSSSPIKEDYEKLSLTRHIIVIDGTTNPDEEEHLKKELRKEIYDGRTIDKTWQKIRSKPLSVEEIFQDKEVEGQIDLYLLACNVALLDGAISQEENELLVKISGPDIANLDLRAVNNIHKLACLNAGFNGSCPLPPRQLSAHLDSSETHQEQYAYSLQLLGEQYFLEKHWQEAKECFREALRLYMILDIRDGIINAKSMLLSIRETAVQEKAALA